MKSEQPSNVVEECMRIVQEHLDREAGNRQIQRLAPRELCAEQKAALVRDLAALLAEPVVPSPSVEHARPHRFSGLLRWLGWRR